MLELAERARQCGIVADSLHHRLGRKVLQEPFVFEDWVVTQFLEFSAAHVPANRKAHNSQPGPPTFFNMLKWKLAENHATEPSLSWRDVISFRHDIFRTWARVVGRCLQLMIRHLATYYATWSFQSLLGVRDQARAATRLQQMGGGTKFMEKDMNDMFWEIPKEQAQQT